jgi:hypothetical protein
MTEHEQNGEPGVHKTTYKQPAGKVPTEATRANMVNAEKIEGETVLVEQSSVDSIEAQRATLKMSKASSVNANSVQMDKSAAVAIDSERTVLQESAAMMVDSDSVRMVKSRAVLVNAEEAHLEDGSQAVLVITGGLTGEARALVTVPAAVVVGAVLAVLAAIVFAAIQGTRR